MKKVTAALLATTALAWTSAALAQATPVGLWKTIDDKTKKERSLVRIAAIGGVYSGKIEKTLDPDSKGAAACDKCVDERKGKPIQGLEIIRNIRPSLNEKGLFDGGDILDPEDGKVYSLRLRLLESGGILEVRGYMGVPLVGRSQRWIRIE